MSGQVELGPNQRPDVKRKIVLAGDDFCGKTSLLLVYAYNKFPEGYIPITSDYVTYLQFGNKIVQVAFWDTVSREEHARLRPLGYLNSHAILIAFSVGSPESFKNVQEKWWPEIAQFCKDTPLIVVATKTELRQDEDTRRMLGAQGKMPVTSEQGAEAASEIGAKYIECSAKMGSGVQEVFTLALQESMKCKNSRRRPKCLVI